MYDEGLNDDDERQISIDLPAEPASPHEWTLFYFKSPEEKLWRPVLGVGSLLDTSQLEMVPDDAGIPDPAAVAREVELLIRARRHELIQLGYLDEKE